MTPEQHELDPHLLLSPRPLTLYRLARARYANLSGLGAALAPGRWNQLGQEAIYTSTEIGIPILERLVHTPKDLIPSNLALMKIHFSGDWETSVFDEQIFHLRDPKTGGIAWICKSLPAARRHITEISFLRTESLALAVPSVILPVWNIVLFPSSKAFWDHVSLESVEPFEFDPRLFPENTPTESAEAG